MFEVMTKLHTATCQHCNGPITMLRGDWSGADWYHDDNGQKTCPGAPRAWPVESTIRDASDSSSTPASEAKPTCDLSFGDGYTCDLPKGHS